MYRTLVPTIRMTRHNNSFVVRLNLWNNSSSSCNSVRCFHHQTRFPVYFTFKNKCSPCPSPGLPRRPFPVIKTHSSYFHYGRRNMDSNPDLTSSLSSDSAATPSENSDYTAGIIVIGDEILKGQTADTNSHFLCKQLFSWGVKVEKISTIGDNLDEIAKEVLEFSSRFTYVITSGGVGPTHDDITFEGVAKAFNESTVLNETIVNICKKYFKTEDMSSPVFKMAAIPTSGRLEFGISPVSGQNNFYPLVCVKNVYMFPGIPYLLEKAFLSHKKMFVNPNSQMHMSELFVNRDEVSITPILNKVDATFEKVQLGSYPDLHNRWQNQPRRTNVK